MCFPGYKDQLTQTIGKVTILTHTFKILKKINFCMALDETSLTSCKVAFLLNGVKISTSMKLIMNVYHKPGTVCATHTFFFT